MKVKIGIACLSVLLLMGCQSSTPAESNEEREVLTEENEDHSFDSSEVQSFFEEYGTPMQKAKSFDSSQFVHYRGAREVDKLLPYKEVVKLNEERLLVNISDRWAILDENLDLIKYLNEDISYYGDRAMGDYFLFDGDNGRYGVMDFNGEILIPSNENYYDYHYRVFDNTVFFYFSSWDGDVVYFISTDGQSLKQVPTDSLIIDEEVARKVVYSDNELAALKDTKTNQLLTDYVYDSMYLIGTLENGGAYYEVEQNGRYGVIDSEGQLLLDCIYSEIEYSYRNVEQVVIKDVSTDEYSIYDLNQQKFTVERIPAQYDKIEFEEVGGPVLLEMGSSDGFLTTGYPDNWYMFTSSLTGEKLIYNSEGELIFSGNQESDLTYAGQVYNENLDGTITFFDEDGNVQFTTKQFRDMIQYENGIYLFEERNDVLRIVTSEGTTLFNETVESYDLMFPVFIGDYMLMNGKVYELF